MMVTMGPRRALGVVLILIGIGVILLPPNDGRFTGFDVLGVLTVFAGVLAATTPDRYVAHDFAPHGGGKRGDPGATYLHRPSCPCGRGAKLLRGRRAILRFAAQDPTDEPIRHARR